MPPATGRGLRSRLATVAEVSIDGLVESGSLSVGTFDTGVSQPVYRRNCGTSYDVELLERHGGECAG